MVSDETFLFQIQVSYGAVVRIFLFGETEENHPKIKFLIDPIFLVQRVFLSAIPSSASYPSLGKPSYNGVITFTLMSSQLFCTIFHQNLFKKYKYFYKILNTAYVFNH